MGQKTNQNILRLGKTREWSVKYIEKKMIEHLLFNNEKVLIDNISVSEKSRIDYINMASKMKKSISAVYVNTDMAVCLERNRDRDIADAVSESLIANLSARAVFPEKREGFSEVVILNNPD